MQEARGNEKQETTSSSKNSAPLGQVKGLVIWFFINGIMATFLLAGIFQGLEWAMDLVKFAVWANFIIWVLILIGGKKSWEANRAKGLPVGPWVNGAYGVMFSCVLASAGFFGYAGMELAIMILQNTIYFSDDLPDI